MVPSVFVLIINPCASSLAIARLVNSALAQTTVWESTSMRVTLSSLKVLHRSWSFTQMKVVVGFVRSFANIAVLPIVQGIELDVTETSSVAELALNCNDVDILINSAGVNRTRGLIATNDLKRAREEMEINHVGTLTMCRAFSSVLKVNGAGCIVNMLSILSWVALPLIGSLCASKAAAFRLADGVWAELNAQNALVSAARCGRCRYE